MSFRQIERAIKIMHVKGQLPVKGKGIPKRRGPAKRRAVETPAVPPSLWTPARVDRLKFLWNDGKTATSIGADLGCFGHTKDGGRSAVLGKVHRLGLAGRAGATGPRTGMARTPRKPRETAVPKRDSVVAKLFRAETYTPPIEELVIPLNERKSIIQLDASTCRWPIGHANEADFHFCGKHPVSGLPYCEFHARRAFKPPQAKSNKPNINAQTVGLGVIDRVNEFIKEKA